MNNPFQHEQAKYEEQRIQLPDRPLIITFVGSNPTNYADIKDIIKCKRRVLKDELGQDPDLFTIDEFPSDADVILRSQDDPLVQYCDTIRKGISEHSQDLIQEAGETIPLIKKQSDSESRWAYRHVFLTSRDLDADSQMVDRIIRAAPGYSKFHRASSDSLEIMRLIARLMGVKKRGAVWNSLYGKFGNQDI